MRVPLTSIDFLRRAEQVYGDRTGIIDEPTQPAPTLGNLSYRGFADRCRAVAAGLDELAIGRGERIAVVSENSARLLELLFGVTATGRICVPINFRLQTAEIAYIIEHCGASVLLADPEHEQVLTDAAGPAVRHRLRAGQGVRRGAAAPRARTVPWEAPDEDATATINYTSGTTARPKGVQITHRNTWINAVTFGLHTGVTDRDVYLHTLPMFHCNGWGMPFAMAGMGVPQVVLRKVDGSEILRRVQRHGVTLRCGAPAVWSAVLESAASWEGPIPGSGTMRIVVAGAPPPTRVIARVGGGARLGIHPDLWADRNLTAGHVQPHPRRVGRRTRLERARLLSRAGAPAIGTEVKIAESGEVLVRSNTVLDGYWEQPDISAQALADDWFHTGDGGTFEDGYVTISDRRKDVIITGGENVSSIEVEDAIFSHPAVAEVAVIGVPDERWGETIKALIVTAEGQASPRPKLSSGARSGSRDTKHRRPSRSGKGFRGRRRARFRSSSCGSPTGRTPERQIN